MMHEKFKLSRVHFAFEVVVDQAFYGTFVNNGYFCFILLHIYSSGM